MLERQPKDQARNSFVGTRRRREGEGGRGGERVVRAADPVCVGSVGRIVGEEPRGDALQCPHPDAVEDLPGRTGGTARTGHVIR